MATRTTRSSLSLGVPVCGAVQRCINPDCAAQCPVTETRTACGLCGELLDVVYDWPRSMRRDFSIFDERGTTRGYRSAAGARPATPAALDFSGVWRFRELLPFFGDPANIVTIGEGRTNLQRADGGCRGCAGG